MKRLVPLLLLLLALLAASCRSTRQTATVPTGESDSPAAPAAPARQRTVTNFNATFEGVGVNGQLRIVEDSAMWVTVAKLIELGRALATPDSVWVVAPMMDVAFGGTYEDLGRKAGRTLSYELLQQMATGPDAEKELTRLAAELGFTATVRITERRSVDHVSMPFRKPQPQKQTR